MTFDTQLILQHLPDILDGFITTIWSTALACALGMILGLFIALALISKIKWIRLPIRFFVEVIRSTPFLIQLFLLYYGGPTIGIRLDPMQAGIIGLAVYGSAYYAELFRAGFNAVPEGQLEVAHIMGFSHFNIMWRIQLPQMMVLIVPGLVNTSIILGKETAVLSIVTVPELTFVLTGIGSETYAYAETLTVLALSYLILAELTSRLGIWAEKRLSKYMEH